MIILTEEQALVVRGETTPGSALKPLPMIDGMFALPEECLADPAHAPHHELLSGLPTKAVGDDEFLHWKCGDPIGGREATITPDEDRKLAQWQ